MAIGRSETLQELITLLESVYDDTIIGTDINLVKHLFYYLKADNKEFNFHYNDTDYLAIIEDIMNESLLLVIPNFKDSGLRRGIVNFEIMNILYQFEVIIYDLRENYLTIKIPTELQSMQLRQNKRILVDDLFMNFIILFRSITGGTRSVGKNLYAESRFPYLMKEIRRDKPNLKLINIMLTDYIKRVSQDYEIVIFKSEHSLTEKDTLIQGVLSKTDKSIFVSDASKIESYIEPIDDENLCNFYYEFKRLQVALTEAESKDLFLGIQKKENREFLVSYIYSAIRIYDEVVGYIKVFTTAMDRYSITQPQAIFIHELAEIINYAFTKVAIQVTSYDEYSYSTRIIDISMNGLLFEIGNKKLFYYLKKHNIIKMNIPLNSNKILVIRGNIVRYLEQNESFYLGVNFFDSNPDDMLHLSNYIFEKNMNILYE